MPKAVLSSKQFVLITYVYLLGASMIFVPEILFADKDAWISTLLGALISVLLLAVWLRLQRKYPRLTLIQYGIKILGPWLGYPIGIYIVFLLLSISSLIAEDLFLIISMVMLPKTPGVVIELTLILVAVYACYKGIETIGRMCELAWLPLTLLILVLPILECQEIGVKVFQPMLQINWQGVLTGTLNSLTFPFAEILVPVILLPYVDQEKRAERYYLLVPLAAGVLLLIRTLLVLMTLGPALANHLNLPVVALFRIIELGKFFNRAEGLFLGIWYIGLLMKLTITFYAAALALAQLTGVRRLENLWLPLAALLFFITHIRFPTYAEFSFTSFYLLPFIALPVELLYPFLLLAVDWFQGKLKPVSIDQLNQGHE